MSTARTLHAAANALAPSLGVRRAVRVRRLREVERHRFARRNNLTDVFGAYLGIGRDGAHEIAVAFVDRRGVLARDVLACAHELVHAAQCERYPSAEAFTAAYTADRSAHGYRGAQLEREAYGRQTAVCAALAETIERLETEC